MTIVCPITSRIKGYPFEVLIPKGFPVAGVVLSDQLKSLDWRQRNAENICALPEAVTQEVLMKIDALLR